MTRVLARGLAGLAVGSCVLGGAGAALAAPERSAGGTATVGDAHEAWYALPSLSTCWTALGCLPVPLPVAPPAVSPWPAGTLHVSTVPQQVTAVSFLSPDLSSLPYGARITRAVMTLPVDTDPVAGSLSPEKAQVSACLVDRAFTDGAEGSTADPPTYDCLLVPEPLVFDPVRKAMTLDLRPFLAEWAAGAENNGIALVPSAQAPAGVWHLVIDGRAHAGTRHVTTSIAYVEPSTEGPDLGGAPVPPAPTGGVATVPLIPPVLQPPPVETAPPPLVEPPPARGLVRQSFGFHQTDYPAVWFLPLLLVIGAGYLGRALTRDVGPVGFDLPSGRNHDGPARP